MQFPKLELPLPHFINTFDAGHNISTKMLPANTHKYFYEYWTQIFVKKIWSADMKWVSTPPGLTCCSDAPCPHLGSASAAHTAWRTHCLSQHLGSFLQAAGHPKTSLFQWMQKKLIFRPPPETAIALLPNKELWETNCTVLHRHCAVTLTHTGHCIPCA